MTVTGNTVANGLIASLARPGGNVTGATYLDPELTAKRFELLKEAMPRFTRLAALVNPNNPQAMGTTLEALETAAKFRKVELQRFEARGPAEVESAFSKRADRRVGAVAVVDDAVFLAISKQSLIWPQRSGPRRRELKSSRTRAASSGTG
jgi:ABC-type uncharacterized transport system substrate-binding protein